MLVQDTIRFLGILAYPYALREPVTLSGTFIWQRMFTTNRNYPRRQSEPRWKSGEDGTCGAYYSAMYVSWKDDTSIKNGSIAQLFLKMSSES